MALLFQSALASLKYSDLLVRMALGSMLEILKQEPFVQLSIKQLMWGFDHPLVKLAKDVLPPERRFPYDDFGFFVGVNFFKEFLMGGVSKKFLMFYGFL